MSDVASGAAGSRSRLLLQPDTTAYIQVSNLDSVSSNTGPVFDDAKGTMPSAFFPRQFARSYSAVLSPGPVSPPKRAYQSRIVSCSDNPSQGLAGDRRNTRPHTNLQGGYRSAAKLTLIPRGDCLPTLRDIHRGQPKLQIRLAPFFVTIYSPKTTHSEVQFHP